MIQTTLCYLEKDGQYLMLLRNKKANDCNEGKWIGIGGKFEAGETAEQCLLREVQEETGVTLTKYQYLGVIDFLNDRWGDEAMHLYLATDWQGEIDMNCNEGELRWIPKEEILNLNLWEGDKAFLQPMLEGKTKLSMALQYHDDKLISVSFKE